MAPYEYANARVAARVPLARSFFQVRTWNVTDKRWLSDQGRWPQGKGGRTIKSTGVKSMKLAIPTFVSVAAFFFALNLTAAQAGAQTDGMSQGGGAPAAGAMSPSGAAGGPAGPSGTKGGPDSAMPKGSAAGSPSMTEDGGRAEGQTERLDDAKDGKPSDRKSGSTAGNQPDTRDGMSEDRKSGATAEGKGDATRDGMSEDRKSGATAQGKGDATRDGMSEDRKLGATAEGKGDARDKAGKNARFESSKVRSHFSQNKPRGNRIDKDDVSVSIGIAIPSAVVLYDLPADVIVAGGPCPIQYFVWGEDVVLVDSCTREVVEIIADVG
jgi:hypothetical protein